MRKPHNSDYVDINCSYFLWKIKEIQYIFLFLFDFIDNLFLREDIDDTTEYLEEKSCFNCNTIRHHTHTLIIINP